jgi:hypothetical protein
MNEDWNKIMRIERKTVNSDLTRDLYVLKIPNKGPNEKHCYLGGENAIKLKSLIANGYSESDALETLAPGQFSHLFTK